MGVNGAMTSWDRYLDLPEPARSLRRNAAIARLSDITDLRSQLASGHWIAESAADLPN